MPSPSFALPALFLLFLFPFSSAHSFHADAQSLLAFKKLINSDPNNSFASWSPTVPLCNWTAITCGRRHPDRVVAIDLDSMDLRGTISPSLGNLSFLRSLNISNNKLHGHIPPQLGRLFRLRWLWLHDNQLEGNIPHQLSSCRTLVWLSLSFNNLSGIIPDFCRFKDGALYFKSVPGASNNSLSDPGRVTGGTSKFFRKFVQGIEETIEFGKRANRLYATIDLEKALVG